MGWRKNLGKKQVDLLPNMLMADERGAIWEHPHLKLAGHNGVEFEPLSLADLIRLPSYSKLFYLPGVRPVGFDPLTHKMVPVDSIYIEGKKIRPHAVGAFLSPGYVRTHIPAGFPEEGRPLLPLWSYTAVGSIRGKFYASAFLVERNYRWDPRNYDDRKILPEVERLKRLFPKNRLVRHIASCALSNHCFAAKNLFLTRWEIPVPTSRSCNARCLGCLSFQSIRRLGSHERIKFRPSVDEIVPLCLRHMEVAPDPIVSFGQGCEGEPLTEYLLIGEAIKEMRKRTKRGTINLNTNGSMPERIRILIEAGLDSIRVSLASARDSIFSAYHRPRGYGLKEVLEGLKSAKEAGLFTMINYLVFPGVTDQEDELEALSDLIDTTKVDFIHLKNLCIDPWFYMGSIPQPKAQPLGLLRFHQLLKERFPLVNFGYFNQIPKGPRNYVY